jgi:hypothetical protein
MLSCKAAKKTRMPIGTLVLLLAVFAWGLQYKISLYHQGSGIHSGSAPPAKLLSDAERLYPEKYSIRSVPSAPRIESTGFHALPSRQDDTSSHVEARIPLPLRDARAAYSPFWEFSLRSPPLS